MLCCKALESDIRTCSVKNLCPFIWNDTCLAGLKSAMPEASISLISVSSKAWSKQLPPNRRTLSRTGHHLGQTPRPPTQERKVLTNAKTKPCMFKSVLGQEAAAAQKAVEKVLQGQDPRYKARDQIAGTSHLLKP